LKNYSFVACQQRALYDKSVNIYTNISVLLFLFITVNNPKKKNVTTKHKEYEGRSDRKNTTKTTPKSLPEHQYPCFPRPQINYNKK